MDNIPFPMMIQGTHNLSEVYKQKPSKVIVTDHAVIEKSKNYVNDAMKYLHDELDMAVRTKELLEYKSYYDIAERAIVIELYWRK